MMTTFLTDEFASILEAFDTLGKSMTARTEGCTADDKVAGAWCAAGVSVGSLVERARAEVLARDLEALGMRLCVNGDARSPEAYFASFDPEVLIALSKAYAWHDVGRRADEVERFWDELDAFD